MKTIGVLANCRKPGAPAMLKRLAVRAAALGMKLVACDETARAVPGVKRVSAKSFARQIDVLLAMGGDGTMLKAVRLLGGSDKPVLGVNLGSLGFLTSVTEERLEKALDVLRKGSYTVSKRTMLECRLFHGTRPVGSYRALNDVVIGWGVSSRVITLEVSVDREPVASYVCDGLIVSTPTGSTGHSLSASGPIVHPASPCLVISLICPHTLSSRPLVIPDSSRISIELTRGTDHSRMSVDGQVSQGLKPGDRIEFRRSARTVRFIHLPGYSYCSVLRQKLHWRGSAR
jgi:NAD+ kinase